MSDEKFVDSLLEVRGYAYQKFKKPTEEGITSSVNDTAPSACVQSDEECPRSTTPIQKAIVFNSSAANDPREAYFERAIGSRLRNVAVSTVFYTGTK